MIAQAEKLIQEEQFIPAIALLTQHLQAHPQDAESLRLRAITFVQMGQTKEALCDAETLLALDSGKLENVLLRADLLVLDGQVEKAIAAYFSLLAEKPTAGNVVLRLGTLLQRERRWKEALTIYGEAIERMPDFAEAYMARGAVKHHLGDMAGAAEDLKHALTLNPHLIQNIQGEVSKG